MIAEETLKKMESEKDARISKLESKLEWISLLLEQFQVVKQVRIQSVKMEFSSFVRENVSGRKTLERLEN